MLGYYLGLTVRIFLPPNHETAKDRIADYARGVKKISDVIFEDKTPLETDGAPRMAEIVKRVEDGFLP